jgi:hypothetical protein
VQRNVFWLKRSQSASENFFPNSFWSRPRLRMIVLRPFMRLMAEMSPSPLAATAGQTSAQMRQLVQASISRSCLMV